MMKRLAFVYLLAAVIASTAQSATGQPSRSTIRIGYLSGASAENDKALLAAFRLGLRELGYIEGKNILIDERYSAGRNDNLPRLAAELLRLQVDVLVVFGFAATRAAKNASSTIPMVMTNVVDPVGTGLVASLAHPGGNITGLSDYHFATITKRLELLKETVPSADRIAVLLNPSNASNPLQLKDLQRAAPTLGATLTPVEVQAPEDFGAALSAIKKHQSGAMIVIGDTLLSANQKPIADFALKNRLPSCYTLREFVEAGGLMSYGTNFADMWRRAAVFVDKILKGAKPADLPIEQPTKFDLLFNLKTAKQIGLTIPPNILARADRVIK
jgi:putative ABC transport system substrate-binding protein